MYDWMYVLSWAAWLSLSMLIFGKVTTLQAIVIAVAYVWLIAVQVIYAVAEQQYAFLFMPVVLIVFSIIYSKVAKNATNNS